MAHELDKRTVEWAYKLRDDLEDGRKEQKQFREINKKYMWKSYGISLILTIAAAFIFNLIDDRDMSLLIVYFISFPFAKIVYDLLLGFKFCYKANKQENFPIYFMQLHYLFTFLVFMFGPIIAPFGILYLILRRVIKFLKQRNAAR